MNSSLRVGRVLGIPIEVNWTWALIFLVLAWSLATGVFPVTNPGLSTRAYVVMAVAAELLFFGSLLLHELAHAVVARREGMAIEGVTLWLFGGVARFRGSFPSAGAEFRIAAAGPAVTAVLAALFVAFTALVPLAPVVDGVLAWLGYINALLLLFNLMPALPLDGGRVLRSILWSVRGDFAWATSVAARIGAAIAIALALVGVAVFLAEDAVSGVWLAMVGWFLYGAARAEARVAGPADPLAGVTVADVMRPTPVTAAADESLRAFIDRARWAADGGAYPVLAAGRPVGMLTIREVVSTPIRDWQELRVRDVMADLAHLTVLRPDTTAADARRALLRDRVGVALVVHGDALAGVVTVAHFDPFLLRQRSRTRGPAAARSVRLPGGRDPVRARSIATPGR